MSAANGCRCVSSAEQTMMGISSSNVHSEAGHDHEDYQVVFLRSQTFSDMSACQLRIVSTAVPSEQTAPLGLG